MGHVLFGVGTPFVRGVKETPKGKTAILGVQPNKRHSRVWSEPSLKELGHDQTQRG